MSTFTSGQQWRNAFVEGQRINGAYQGGVHFYERVATNVSLKNIVPNGSFETNTTGWTGSGTLSRIALPVSHGESGSWCGQNSHRVNGAHSILLSPGLSVVSGNQYYIRARTRFTSNGYGNIVQFQNNATNIGAAVTMTVNQWSLLDCIWQANSSTFPLRLNFTNGNGNTDRTAQCDNIMVINLTAAFGAGNEPDALSMRSFIASKGGYWDGDVVTVWDAFD